MFEARKEARWSCDLVGVCGIFLEILSGGVEGVRMNCFKLDCFRFLRPVV